MSDQNTRGKKAKVPQAILMRDLDEPNIAKLVAQDEESDSEFEEIFEEEVMNGWVGIRHLDALPKEDYVKRGKQLEEEGRMKQNFPTRLKYEAKKTATLAVQVSDVIVRAGVNIAVENINHYATRETAGQLLRMLWKPSSVVTGVRDTYDKVLQEFGAPKTRPSKVAELEAIWSCPADSRITDPRDAPEGSNLDHITIIPYEPPVREVAYLREGDGGGDEMEEVSLSEDEIGDGDEAWMLAVEELSVE